MGIRARPVRAAGAVRWFGETTEPGERLAMTRLASLLAITLLASACAESGPQRKGPLEAKPRSYAMEPLPSPAPPMTDYATGGDAPPSAAPSPAARAEAKSGRAYEAEAARDERPGLGTSWGETRESHVSSAAFERRDGNQPFTVTSISYNDAAGVRAMTRGASLGAAPRDGIDIAGGAVRVRFLDGSHRQLPTFDFGSRRFVVGQDGERYTIALENRTEQRFEAVASVDGLDVIDGQPGSYAKRGYLLGPWQTVEIDGFRRSYDEVAAFRFGSVSSSYAARKGDDRNVGVIGVALFAERGSDAWLGGEAERRRRADPFPGRFATPPGSRWE